jgi:hypothetical protein
MIDELAQGIALSKSSRTNPKLFNTAIPTTSNPTAQANATVPTKIEYSSINAPRASSRSLRRREVWR